MGFGEMVNKDAQPAPAEGETCQSSTTLIVGAILFFVMGAMLGRGF
ncbi:MAG: hypothetical protein NT007_09655 [Candidatus Kapabacteria bacterium]|nr:hypothetical protein [Candidatus Kapabacteria bacterium]